MGRGRFVRTVQQQSVDERHRHRATRCRASRRGGGNRVSLRGAGNDGGRHAVPLRCGFLRDRPVADRRNDRGPRENLALDASVVDVSSEFGGDFAGSLAIDGDLSTEWSTSGDGDDGFITIDLGAEQDLGGVEFVTRSMADGTAVTETFTVSVDGGDVLGPFPAGTSRSLVEPTSTSAAVASVSTSTGRRAGMSARWRSVCSARQRRDWIPRAQSPLGEDPLPGTRR